MKKVIIIGAGVAGLSAAKHLDKEKFDVTLLEANGYIGGRIHTVRKNEMNLDLGVELVHGKKLETYKLLKQEGATLLKQEQPLLNKLSFGF